MYRAKTKITPSSNFGLLFLDQWHYLAHGPAIISYHSFQIDAHCFWNIGKHFYCSVKMFQWRAFFSVIKLKIECFYGIPSNVNELNGEAECKEKHAKVIAIIPCFKKKEHSANSSHFIDNVQEFISFVCFKLLFLQVAFNGLNIPKGETRNKREKNKMIK